MDNNNNNHIIMDRIIIATNELSREIWGTIYRFVRSIAHNEDLESKKKAFHEIIKCARIRLNTELSEKKATDVYSLYGEEIGDNQLGFLSQFTCFSILYQKLKDEEDFTELVPFILFQHEFGNAITLGIDITRLKTQSYRFKCSNFFILFDEAKPRLGRRNIYFINTNGIRVVDKETGEIRIARTMSFAGKGVGIQNKYEGKPSRRFLPLIPITKDNYKSIFGLEQESSSKELAFVNNSIEIIRKELGKRNSLREGSPLDRWLEAGYFYSYSPNELKRKGDREISNIRNIIQVYTNSIFELIQNIIFHGGGEGLIYCVFDKKKNISKSYQKSIPNFDNYGDDMRFLRVGICDFSKLGIVDTYSLKTIHSNGAVESEDMSLADFFDINSIATTGLSKLEMRYAARLGIKTFVKTIINNKGYFRVESNKKIDNNKTIKETFHTVTNKNSVQLGITKNDVFLNGTHYEIVVPLIGLNNNIFPLQMGWKNDFQNDCLNYPPIFAQPFLVRDLLNIHNSPDKESQVANIKGITDNILRQRNDSNHTKQENIVALYMIGKTSVKDAPAIFKIVSCLQLSNSGGYEKVILSNVTDEFSDELFRLIDTLILDNGSDEIWSRNSAIIIISENLQIRIIWGKTKSELDYINQKVHNYKNFFAQTSNQVQKSTIEITDEAKKKAKDFIAPYDFMVFSPNNVSLFEGFVLRCLEKEIISNDIVGFLANHTNTYIGNKIIVKYYYEADMLFQNGFFAEKFALLIAQNIQYKLRTKKHKKILLIGYKQYSDFLLKRVSVELQECFKDVFCAIASGDKDISTVDIYSNDEDEKENYGREMDKTRANKGKDILNTDILFNFNIGNSEKVFEENILHDIENYCIITIVPIGSTLSTNDKIIAGFKQWYKRKNEEKKINDKIKNLDDLANNPFVYNHCVIVVRNEVGATVTKIEEEQGWRKVDVGNHLIETQFQNARIIYYTIQIAKTTDDNDNTNWEKRLNGNISFPLNWKDEKYVNYTENSSINSQNLMGFPQAVPLKSIDYNEELSRLYEFKNDIYKGHIGAGGCHHKYYIDTESFVNRKTDSFQKWLVELKKEFRFDKLDVLITPNAEYESDFLSLVNEKVFDGKALVVYLDVKNWRNNIVHKLSFLNCIPKSNVRFHYVDHALLTGATFQETRSYLFSIMDYKDVQFESIITIINRLSFAKYKEIVSVVKDEKLLSYVSLHYPSNDGEQECELCKLNRYYKLLKDKTVLDSCQKVIWENQVKLKLIPKFRIRDNPNRKKEDNIHSKRIFLRLVMTHEIYHEVSQSIDSLPYGKKKNWNECKRKVKQNLDELYKKLCYICQHKKASPFIQYIDNCYGDNVFLDTADLRVYYEKKKIVDKKIAFLKVISSPPLSQYIVIREYAYTVLLDELHSIINKAFDQSDDITYDDLKIAKAILKSLSFLKSNALVRKDVIVGVWTVLRWVVYNYDTERSMLMEHDRYLLKKESKLKRELGILKQEKYEIEHCKNENRQNTLNFDESPNELIDGHIEDKIKEIEPTLNSITEFREELESEQVYRYSKKEIIQDFSRDIQFFVKNSIVEDDAKATFMGELLRKGTEMTNFDIIGISETFLYLEKNKSDCSNEIFHHFDNVNDEVFKDEYVFFLVWLFYDNTTIIRKTLDHFAKEIEKDTDIYNLFYKDNCLINIKEFKKNICKATEAFKGKVNNEYYYHSFRPYLKNGDKIDYVEKLIFVTYAKRKLEDLNSQEHKTYIEADTRDLMELFAAIMAADSAFLTMKKEIEVQSVSSCDSNDYHLYPISIYDKSLFHNEKEIMDWNYDLWNVKDDFYTGKVFTFNDIKAPIVPIHKLYKKSIGERKYMNANGEGVYVITDPKFGNMSVQNSQNEKRVFSDNIGSSPVATVSFLFKNKLDEKDFRVNLQESGRLLLLLKNDINKYLIGYLVKNKALDLWEQKYWSERRYEKAYSNSNHVFNSVFGQMEEFENIKFDVDRALNRQVKKYFNTGMNAPMVDMSGMLHKKVEDMVVLTFGRTWYWLTNEMISYLYSNIVKHQDEYGRHYLLLDNNDEKIKENHTTQSVFNELFIKLLKTQLLIRWVGQQIEVNGISILGDFSYSKIKIPDVNIHCNKYLMQTFIVQCLNNTLQSANEEGGHRICDVKKAVIIIDNNSIKIRDEVVKGKAPSNENVQTFLLKEKMIKQMNCKKYSCTTLTSLQGFINYMNQQEETGLFDCKYGYNSNNNFEVIIYFNKQINKI